MFFALALVLAVPPTPVAVLSGDNVMRSLRAARRTGPIVIDGTPDEPAWLAAEEGTGFRQKEPTEGAPATEPTRFRVLWDDEAIYVGVWCDDSRPPTVRMARRDTFVDGDMVNVDIDSELDRRTAYHFSVFAAGQQLDGLHYNDTSFTTDWDAVWESAVARTDRGWSVEMKIPLRVLRVPEGVKEMGFNVFRILHRRREEDQWKWTPRGLAGDVSQLGRLTGLEGVKPRRELEVKPYLAARATKAFPAPGPRRAPATLGFCPSVGLTNDALSALCAGLDVKLGLTSDLVLVGAVNPDFGQVEADQRVLNLSTFETFFPEKRPFFLEGLDLYQPPVRASFGGPYGGDAFRLFYSRRIGRPPGAPDLPSDATVLSQPSARPILEAAKLSGEVHGATVGLVDTVEPATRAQVLYKDGSLGAPKTDETVHSAIGRARIPLGERGFAGAMVTAYDPLFAPGARHAHSGGVDLTLFDEDRDWNFAGQLAGSVVTGGAPDVQRDGIVIGDGASGLAGEVKLSKEAGWLQGYLQADWMGPRFEVNELGYAKRANLARAVGMVQASALHQNALWQRANAALVCREVHDAGLALVLNRNCSLEGFVLLNSYWDFGGGGAVEPGAVDDRELGDGTPLELQPGWASWAFLDSDSRAPIVVSLFGLQIHRGPVSERYHELGATVVYKPAPRLQLQLDLSWNEGQGTWRRIRAAAADGDPANLLAPDVAATLPRTYLLARQSAAALSSVLRATYAFSPLLTLQVFAQVFGADVVYGAPTRATAAPGKSTVTLASLVPATAADVPPASDDRQASLDANVVLRWEWRLGSALFLVYSHSSANELTPMPGALSFARDYATLPASAGAAGTDTFLVKVDFFRAL